MNIEDIKKDIETKRSHESNNALNNLANNMLDRLEEKTKRKMYEEGFTENISIVETIGGVKIELENYLGQLDEFNEVRLNVSYYDGEMNECLGAEKTLQADKKLIQRYMKVYFYGVAGMIS